MEGFGVQGSVLIGASDVGVWIFQDRGRVKLVEDWYSAVPLAFPESPIPLKEGIWLKS